MDDHEYPTELVSHAFFGDKKVSVGDKETIEVVSVDEDHVQVRCISKGKRGSRPDYAKETAMKYNQAMTKQPPTVGL